MRRGVELVNALQSSTVVENADFLKVVDPFFDEFLMFMTR